jgi:hypothetical protein
VLQSANLHTERFSDPSDFASASCGPCYPKDDPSDIFLDCLELESRLNSPTSFPSSVLELAMRAFRTFWKEWSQIEEVPSHASGEEGAIALLQTMTQSKTRETRLNAFCYLLAIGRTSLSQTDVARLFWGEESGKKHRATVNARVIAIRDDLNLGKARGMKKESARKSYSFRATQSHTIRITQETTLWKTQLPSLAQQAISLRQ